MLGDGGNMRLTSGVIRTRIGKVFSAVWIFAPTPWGRRTPAKATRLSVAAIFAR